MRSNLPFVMVMIFLLAGPPVASPAPVSALAYRADHQILAAGGYGHVTLIDPATGTVVGTRNGQTKQVTAVAFNGTLLVVASGEPGRSGELRFYDPDLRHTIIAHKDLIYAIAFSPDGKTMATTGYDRVIKLWDVGTAQLVRTLTDHSDTVYGIAFRKDGQYLASVSADRAVKIWDTKTGVRLFTLSDSTDWLYALAWHPNGNSLAAAGVDKSIRVWAINGEGGKLVHSVFAHEAPVTKLVYSGDGQTLYSLGEDRIAKTWDTSKMVEKKVFATQPETVLSMAIRGDDKQLALGRFDGVALLLDPATGQPTSQPLPVKELPKERFPPVMQIEPSESPRTAQDIPLPASVFGTIDRAGDADYLRFEVKAGESIGVEVKTTSISSKLDALVELTDDQGRVLTEARDGVIGFTFEKAGRYSLGIRDRDYRGAADMTYRLNIGPIPIVTSVFPLGLPRGTEGEVSLRGVFIDQMSVKVKVPADAKPGTKIPVPLIGSPLGRAEVVVGEFAEIVGPGTLSVPGAGHGFIDRQAASQSWKFAGRKGQRLIIEVHARRFGSPLDSSIEILDEKGEPVVQKTLRCVARVFTTFRDNDSAIPTIRLESWNELAMKDFVYIGTELMRIDQLPKNADDDCRFVNVAGRRQGYFGTTPSHHSNGSPVYKVELHPPGSTFPSNGMPLFHLPFRNDDGQGDINPMAGKDSHLFFDVPADGTYQVRVMDARGTGRPDFAYRVTVREPKPDFTIAFNPRELKVWKGNGIPVTVTATRIDGFDGLIDVKLDHLPPGFEAPPTRIEAGQNEVIFPVWASATAQVPSGTTPVKLVARSKEIVREAVGMLPSVVEPGDLMTTTNVGEVMLRPGSETRLIVTIERRNGFAERVPLEVRGLPYGVRVLNIGLNGILVTPGITSREIVLYAEPWVEPMTVPIVVLSKREGKNTEHVAKPVMLRIEK